MTEQRMAYIARVECGCIIAACVDSPDHRKDTAKFCAEAVRNGETIERVPVEYVRENMRTCPHKGEQDELLPVSSQRGDSDG